MCSIQTKKEREKKWHKNICYYKSQQIQQAYFFVIAAVYKETGSVPDRKGDCNKIHRDSCIFTLPQRIQINTFLFKITAKYSLYDF